MTTFTPPSIGLNIDGVPPELRALPHWVAWKLTPPKKPGGKFGKVPIDPKSGKNASTTNATTWGSFDGALARMQQNRLAGIGFVFTDSGYVGVDIDHCRDPESGAISFEATETIKSLDTYAEVSPSGSGVHVFGRGKLPGKGRRKGNVEIYDTGRFFTVTGVPVPGVPPTIFERQVALDELYARLGSEPEDPETHGSDPESGFADLDDDEIVRRASAARGWQHRGLRIRERSRLGIVLPARLLDARQCECDRSTVPEVRPLPDEMG
jgi:primase-polymerase (primpol)-like protein